MAGKWVDNPYARADREVRVRDEEYDHNQLPTYGDPAQPAIAGRAGPELHKVEAGTLSAAGALVLSLVAVWWFPAFRATDSGQGWALTLAACSLLMLAACGYQLFGWRRALRVWRGRAPDRLSRLSSGSWLVHVLSYAVVAVAVWAAVAGSAAAGWSATAAVLLLVALALLIVALLLGAVQYVRASGPPGTVPAHMHRLTERDDRRAGRRV